MKSMFVPSLDVVLTAEGKYSNDPKDPGGETIAGISRLAHPDWKGWKEVDGLKVSGHFTEERAYDAVQKDLQTFYKREYWDKIQGDELPAGIDTYLFDMAVNIGYPRAIRILQGVVGATVDGILGPKTLIGITNTNKAVLLDRLLRKRITYYASLMQSLSDADRFMEGWINRSLDIYTLSQEEL